MENWKDVVGFEGLYMVSDLGRVYGVKKNKILKPYKDKKGYIRANLTDGNIRKNSRVHRLVAIAFINNPNNYDSINHKDEDKTNNKLENLEWCDNEYNNKYGSGRIRASKNTCKKVGQYNLDGELIKEWESLISTKQGGFCVSSVSSCCHNRNNRNIHKGHIWKLI